MRCPTCGRRVRENQESCSFCGAYLRSADLASAGRPPAAAERKPIGSPIPGPAERPVPEPHGFPVETSEQEAEEFEDLAPEPRPGETPPATPPASAPPARPKYAGLLRILFPLLFILIPLLNMLVRNSPFGLGPDEQPVLQETQFFENIAGGRFVNPQTVFSRSRHERVVLFARWSGSRGRHTYSFHWYTPEGTRLPDTSTVARFQFGRGDNVFSAYAILPLRAELPIGMWRVEIAVDEEVQASPTFELRE